MRMKKIILFSVLSLIMSCSYHSTSGLNPDSANSSLNEPGDPSGATPTEPTVRFADVKTNVFDTSCTTCHESRGLSLNFSSYANVTKYLTRIKNDVFVNGSMPPQGDLTALQKQVLKTWLDSGAPE